MIERIHHMDYVVRDLDRASEQLETVFGLQVKERKVLEGNREVALFEIDDFRIALVRPLGGEESLASRWLNEQGEGFFHVAFKVDDLDRRVAELEAKGISFIEKPKPPGLGWRVATIDPEYTVGVLTQLVGE